MKLSACILTVMMVIFLGHSVGCSGSQKPLTENEKKAIDDEMKKAIERNKGNR